MIDSRRKALKLIAALAAAGVVSPGALFAQDLKSAFDMKSLAEAMKALGAQSPAASDAIAIKAPEIAENGAVVPVTVASTLANVEQISVFVDKNPNVMAANFVFPAGTEGMVTTRVKMGQTASVVAVVKADGKFYRTSKEVKVTAGGCGG